MTALARNQVMLEGIPDITCQAVQRHDDTFTEARRTGGIVDRTDLLVASLIKMYILRPVALRMVLLKLGRDSLEIDLLWIKRQRYRVPVIQTHGCQHFRNLVQVNTLPIDVTDE